MNEAIQLYIHDPVTKQLRMTPKGIARYATRFAKAGFNIRQIKTQDALKKAIDASFAFEMQALPKASTLSWTRY